MKTYRDIDGDGGSGVLEQVIAQRERVAANLAGVRRLVAVMSGKGGVGKSTVTVHLAAALALRGERVAIVDADLNGPSVPRLLGLERRPPRVTDDGMIPPEAALGIRVMSSDLFLGGEAEPLRYDGPSDDPFTWRPTAEATTLREFLGHVVWGERDWLLVDLPPGADRLPAVKGLLPGLRGVVAVTLGSPLSLQVVKKSLTVAGDAGVEVLGLVENMAGTTCGECGSGVPLFGAPDATAGAAAEMGVPLLGSLPFDPALVEATERGALAFGGDSTPCVSQTAYDRLAGALLDACRPDPDGDPSP